MSEKMLKFIDLDKQTPKKRNIDQRKEIELGKRDLRKME